MLNVSNPLVLSAMENLKEKRPAKQETIVMMIIIMTNDDIADDDDDYENGFNSRRLLQ